LGKKKQLLHHPEHHPAFRLLEEAATRLKPLFEAAAQHDARLYVHRGEGGNLMWRVGRKPREPRDLHAFARLAQCRVDSLVQDDAYIGLILTLYDPERRSQAQLGVCLTYRLSEGRWILDYEGYMGRRRTADVKRFLRRVGLRGTRKRILRQKEAEKIASKFAKEFKEHVIIPRAMREKARKR